MPLAKTTTRIFSLLIALALVVTPLLLIGCGDDDGGGGAAKQIQDLLPPSTADMPTIAAAEICTTIGELASTYINGDNGVYDHGFVEAAVQEYQGDGGVLDNAQIRLTITNHTDATNAELVFDHFHGEGVWIESPDFDATVYTQSGLGSYQILFQHATYLIQLQIYNFSSPTDAQTKLNSFADHVLIELGE